MPDPIEEGPKTYTYAEAQAFFRGDQNAVEALMQAGLISDEVPSEGTEKPPWQEPQTVEEVVVILARMDAHRARLAKITRQFKRRSAPIDHTLAYYETQVMPHCVELIEAKVAEQKGPERHIDTEDMRLQLRRQAERYKLKDQRALASYMESLESDLVALQSRWQVLGAKGAGATPEEKAELISLRARGDEIFAILDPFKGAMSLAVVRKETLTGAEAWERMADPPDEDEEYVVEFDEKQVLAVVKAVPSPDDVPFAPPGIDYVPAETKLYSE